MPMSSRPLQVVHLCTSDSAGGAAIAAHRLMMAQREAGLNASMLVLHASRRGAGIYPLRRNSAWSRGGAQWKKSLEVGAAWLAQGFRLAHIFDVSLPIAGFSLKYHPLILGADVIHIHWINQGFLDLSSLRSLIHLKKKVIFTLHDEWAFTSVCHHARDCRRFTETPGCHDCPQLQPGIPFFDPARSFFRAKQALYKELSPSFVGCSEWIAAEARQSLLTQGCRVEAIPNIFDSKTFTPIPREQARIKLGSPADRPILLFGAARTDDPRKGFAEMLKALQIFYATPYAQEQKPLALLFGKISHPELLSSLAPIEFKCVGYLSPQEMALHYAAANLYVTPSLEENLPNTIIEAAAMECPTVAFEVGGIPEIITHGVTGYLARYRDVPDLARGIEEVLRATEKGPIAQCRTDVLHRYDTTNIVQRYLNVYTS